MSSLSQYFTMQDIEPIVRAVVPTMEPYVIPRLYLISNLADDAATYIEVDVDMYAAQLIISNNNSVTAAQGILNLRVTAGSVFSNVIAGHANVIASTGILTGTTGTDGRLTISPHTNRRIYIENRMGLSLTLCVQLAGVNLAGVSPVP